MDHAIAFDRQLGRTILFGGKLGNGSSLADTWQWNGANWEQVAITGPSRYLHALAYDVQRGRTVLFGGFGFVGDTWEWGVSSTPATASAFGTGCGSPALVLSPVAGADPIFATMKTRPESTERYSPPTR